MEEIKFIIDTAKEGMDNAISHLEKQLNNIRAGKASPAMLGSVMVEYYGSQTPLTQVANVNTPDARTISIQPYEKSIIITIVIIIIVVVILIIMTLFSFMFIVILLRYISLILVSISSITGRLFFITFIITIIITMIKRVCYGVSSAGGAPCK